MFFLRVFDYFSSAHFLNGYEGKCESLHGHNWKVEVEVRGKKLDKIGMLMDFKILKNSLKKILDKLDHCLLNDLKIFKNNNPSAELISQYVYEELQKQLPKGINVSKVSVWESERSQAIYSEE
jgi:6-pyruvoyltetrahydropterin/6-carboxytetrahydropterin synthase